MGHASVWPITPEPGSQPFLRVSDGARALAEDPATLRDYLPNDLFTYFPPVGWEKLQGCCRPPEERRVSGDREAAGGLAPAGMVVYCIGDKLLETSVALTLSHS